MWYNLLFRWFVVLNLRAPAWDVTIFTKNRDRLWGRGVNEAPRNKLRGITELNFADFSEAEANPVASYGNIQVQPGFSAAC